MRLSSVFLKWPDEPEQSISQWLDASEQSISEWPIDPTALIGQPFRNTMAGRVRHSQIDCSDASGHSESDCLDMSKQSKIDCLDALASQFFLLIIATFH